MSHPNSFGSRATLVVGDRQYAYFHLGALDALPGTDKSLMWGTLLPLEPCIPFFLFRPPCTTPAR